jgi:hypothetical protein
MRFSLCTVLACLSLAACGNGGAPAPGGASIGPVDLTQSPATLALSCEGVTTALALKMPCLVGLNLNGPDSRTVGAHEVECDAAQPGDPYVWSFMLPLSAIANDPSLVLSFPLNLPATSPPTGSIDLDGEKAHVSGVTGSLSFRRVDPDARAFEGAFAGTMKLKSATSTAEVTCTVDGPFWGAPGGFI